MLVELENDFAHRVIAPRQTVEDGQHGQGTDRSGQAVAGRIGEQRIEAAFRRAAGGDDVAAEVLRSDHLVLQAFVGQAMAMQLLFHQAHCQLLLVLGLVVIGLQQAGVFVQFLFGLLAFGDVAHDADEHPLVVENDLGNAEGDGKAVSVAVQGLDLAFTAHAGAEALGRAPGEVAVVIAAGRFRHQHFDVLAQHFFGRPAESAFRGAVDRGNDAVFVDRDDGVEHVVRNRLDPAQRIDRLLLHAERTLHRAQLGFEYDEVDRFGQVVVGAGIEAFDQILIAIERREENDRRPFFARHALDPPGGFEAIHDRHHDVEQDQVGCVGDEAADGFLAVLGEDHLMSQLLQEDLKDVKIGAIVVNRENLHLVH